MDTADLDYDLPAESIAQQPIEPRDAARLLVAGEGRSLEHRTVADLPDLIEPGSLVVVNDTRVIPARLILRKPTGGAVEVLLLDRRADGDWEALVKPSRRVADGTVLTPADGDLMVTVGEVLGDDGRRRVSVVGEIESVGEVPLPPYIHETLDDPERYQTVYAQNPGSVAAPTAGLHLTPAVLDRLGAQGTDVLRVELVVGLGTFRPITADKVTDHAMHGERYRIPEATRAALAGDHGPVVAIGTTVVRALESWAATGEAEGTTELFIHGDYPFALVDRLLTNFHVPRSSLLAMIEAFAGPGWRHWYRVALDDRYRFLSFGDAMLLDRRSAR